MTNNAAAIRTHDLLTPRGFDFPGLGEGPLRIAAAEPEPSWTEALVAATDEAIVSYSLDQTIVTWNPGAERLYGYAEAQAVGRGLSLTAPPGRVGEVERAIARLRMGERSLRLATVGVTKNGTLVDVDLTLAPIRDGWGRVVGTAAVARDVTEERWVAATLDETMVKLEAALAEAQRSEARSRQFLADVAHRLRNLTAGVQLTAQAARQTTSRSRRDPLLCSIVRETALVNGYVRSLLRMARLDAGMPLEPAPCDLDAVCRDQVALARTLAPHLENTYRDGPGTDLVVADAQAVEEIVENLLDNARRHAATCIEVSTVVQDGTVVIGVVDDGPGMTDDVASRAFERFVSLDGQGGSGIGLAICRELARAHGGDVTYGGPADGFLVTLLTDIRPSRSGGLS